MKQIQRKQALAKRNALSLIERKAYDQSIVEKLRSYLGKVNAIYLPYGSEVDITALICNREQVFAIPKTYEDLSMRFFRYDEHTKVEKSNFGILEPLEFQEIKHFDVIIVPLVAFDEEGHRLGYGKGFYDRFLKSLDALVIGVAYECQKLAKVAVEEHDQVLDMIISEKQIYHIK